MGDDGIVVPIGAAPSLRAAASAQPMRAGKSAVAQAADFEREIAKAAALVAADAAEIDRMRQACLEASASRSAFSPVEIAEVATYGVTGGLTVGRVTELLGDHRLGINRIDAEVRNRWVPLAKVSPWRVWRTRVWWLVRCAWWQASYRLRAELRDLRRVWF